MGATGSYGDALECSAGMVPLDDAAQTKVVLETQAYAEQVGNIFSYVPTTQAANAAGIAIVLMLYWSRVPQWLLMAWFVPMLVLGSARYWMLAAYRRARPQALAALMVWYQRWRFSTLCAGVLWGSAAWFFYGYGGETERLGLILTVYSFCMAAMQILSPQHRTFYEFSALALVPLVIRVAWPGTFESWLLAAVLVSIFMITVALSRLYSKNYAGLLQIKLRADRLLLQLRVEKAAAETARQEAEVANRAKTQFFAAASHDLRQPLHAMGLFAEALRQRSHDEEVVHLVNSINGSVDALEGLFSELLDITKIDTGGVDVRPEHFNIGDVFRKLRLHFEPVAFEKGIALRFRGHAHNLYADPILLERIVRNLVSNAIRYTNDGTVLVSCRRRGPRLLVQVWDTGVGIREHEQARIFEEFYQVPYSEALSPQQRKGLGLGLAIVKRLAQLMEAPVQMRSQPGKGTVFALELPPGKARPMQEARSAGKSMLGITLDHKFIVVVEDEPSVRGGLEVLLKGWGAVVASFETVRAAQAWCAGLGPDAPVPDLLIVDHRLEQGVTGVDAIHSLRRHFQKPLPAIMVTGSTMSDLEQEAQSDDFHLLLKPVVPNKLRAMIAFKLQVRSVDSV
jgi:two-component system, sensor histidine kinase